MAFGNQPSAVSHAAARAKEVSFDATALPTANR
jgi:hypothetical protein